LIISHKHKFIFIKTEKTAGTSIEIALSKYCGPDDIITPLIEEDENYRNELSFTGKQNYFYSLKSYSKNDVLLAFLKQKKLGFYNHMSALQIKKRIPSDIWNSYFKFCFERNPYDKFISWYYWSGGDKKYGTMKNFIKSRDAFKVLGFSLYSINSMPVVDHVFKFEELDKSMQIISERLNLNETIFLPSKKTKGQIRKDKSHYSDILTEYEIDWISKVYAREMAFFDYSF
jgi:hypothetical protein